MWCYETIKSTTFSEEEDFIVKPKKSYDVEDTKFNQLEFLLNHSLFIFPQFKLAESYKDKDEFKKMQIHFSCGAWEEWVRSIVIGEDNQACVDNSNCFVWKCFTKC